MQSERPGTARRQAGSTRLLSTEELFEGFNELYESAESEREVAAAVAPSGPIEIGVDGSEGAQSSHLEITESGDAFNVRAELHSFDRLELQQPVHRRGLVPGQLGQPLGGPAGRRDQRDFRVPGPRQRHDRADGEALAAAGAAGQHRDLLRERHLDRVGLLGGQLRAGLRLQPGQGLVPVHRLELPGGPPGQRAGG